MRLSSIRFCRKSTGRKFKRCSFLLLSFCPSLPRIQRLQRKISCRSLQKTTNRLVLLTTFRLSSPPHSALFSASNYRTNKLKSKPVFQFILPTQFLAPHRHTSSLSSYISSPGLISRFAKKMILFSLLMFTTRASQFGSQQWLMNRLSFPFTVASTMCSASIRKK